MRKLNEAAVASGLLPQPTDFADADLDGEDDDAPRELSPEKGRARATRLLEMAGRAEDDESPAVPGTAFTEAGVVRLMAHLRKRQVRRFPFLRRLHRFLTLPVTIGMRTSAGIAVERLQAASRQLKDIEAQGWERYSAIRDARRFGSRPPPPEPKASTRRSSQRRTEKAGASADAGVGGKKRAPGKAKASEAAKTSKETKTSGSAKPKTSGQTETAARKAG